MNGENAIHSADFFLREVPNVKISSESAIKRPVVKEELQFLRLTDEAQEQILDTLKFIHGPDFKLNDASAYEDISSNLSKKYWMGRGSLVVKGGFDFSQLRDETTPNNENDRLKQFALLRLESYGFHKNHCIEALNYCSGDVEDSLYLLYNKYFNADGLETIDHGLSEQELLEHRVDEKSSLESIYEKSFHEKVVNSVWILTLKLDYLIRIFHRKERIVKQVNKGKTKEKCKNFIRGQCKFGNKCRFSHQQSDPIPESKNPNSHLEDFQFELEIRFASNTQYPYDPPMIFLKTNAILPPLVNLHICKRLHNEAKILAESGISSIYSIAELLQNEEEITNHLKIDPNFIGPHEKLFSDKIVRDPTGLRKPTHYTKGLTNRNTKKKLTIEELSKINASITEKFRISTKSDRKYLKMLESRKTLPAWSLQKDILNTIHKSQVSVVSGETGCGKSTQIPQFILDDWLRNYDNQNAKHIEIVCTQPRRISAIGVAERVADERNDKIGNLVGYQIRLESKVSSNTRLTFCTTGILLRRLEGEPNLSNVTHVIVDEVHERTEESDFLLLILKELLPIRPDLKVILMSATMNTKLFVDYFGDVPLITIPGRTFPVQQYFLEDIIETTGYTLEAGSEYSRHIKHDFDDFDFNTELSSAQFPETKIKDENLTMMQTVGRYNNYCMKTCMNLFLMDPNIINNELIENVLTWITSGKHDYPKQGTILVFLPGIAEITSLYDYLNTHPDFGERAKKFLLLPLHSSLTNEEQSAIFKKPQFGVRKIVISTNIAETSITIDDCVFVIDAGRMKEKHFDPNRNMETLATVWVTRANALQRKGRAGRVMPGVCIHLYTSHRFQYHMLAQPIPEIQRIPLEQLVLKIKVLQNFYERNVADVLGALIQPPVDENIQSAIVRLQNVGALDKDNDLTPLGHHLAALPVDVRIGKLMLYGSIFGCIDSALTIAACLSYKSPFVTPFGKKDQANNKKKQFATGNSDQLSVLTAYKKWLIVYNKSRTGGWNFANENFLSHKTMITIADIKHQFLEFLVDIGFVPINLDMKRRNGQDNVLTVTGSEFNQNGDNLKVLASVICAALYPNVIKILTPSKSYVMSSVGAVPKVAEAKELKFATVQEMIFMHPSSINYTISNFPSPYLVYQEKVRTSKIFFRDCTMVPVISLILFSGSDLDISVRNGCTFISLEKDWIMFQVEEHKIAEMIKMMRTELFALLEEKIKDPLLNLLHHDKGEKIISTILNLINSR